jgi:hypothetical protein
MSNKLENFVRENRTEFDTAEPNELLWDKIEQTLPHKKLKPVIFIKYAAAIAIFMAGIYSGVFLNNKGLIAMNEKVTPEQEELIESEYYYTSEINERLSELKPYFAKDPQLEYDLEADLNELDEYYKSLKTDLKDNVNNEEVVEAMIHSYRMKLDILESLLQQLKKQNDETITYHL